MREKLRVGDIVSIVGDVSSKPFLYVYLGYTKYAGGRYKLKRLPPCMGIFYAPIVKISELNIVEKVNKKLCR